MGNTALGSVGVLALDILAHVLPVPQMTVEQVMASWLGLALRIQWRIHAICQQARATVVPALLYKVIVLN